LKRYDSVSPEKYIKKAWANPRLGLYSELKRGKKELDPKAEKKRKNKKRKLSKKPIEPKLEPLATHTEVNDSEKIIPVVISQPKVATIGIS
jgi:hypothetical protein